MLLTDYLAKGARLHPDGVFLRFQGRASTYRECNKRVNRLAHALRGRFNVGKGDRVAVLSRNHPAMVETYLACGKIGAVTVPLNYRLHPDDFVYLLNHARARLLILEAEFLEVYQGIAARLESIEFIVVIGEGKNGQGYEELLTGASPDEPARPVSEDDVMVHMYASASEGVPKGVLLTHRNLLSTALGVVLDARLNADRCQVLVVAPIFFVGALITIFAAMVAGASCNLKKEFHPEEALKGMSEEGATHTFLVPVMIRALLNVPGVERRDYSRLRVLLYGAAPAHPPLLKRAMEVFRCEFIQGYGLTECTGILGLLLHEDHLIRPTATCREFRMAEIRVVNEQGEPVKPDEVGEIVGRGHGIMRGYWDMEEETEAVFLNGWLRTGDLAILDEQGYITVVDRRRDMIIRGGENIFPREIEKILLAHPEIRQATVIGVPDEKWGEEIKALVVPQPGRTLNERALMRFCREHLARFKCPRSFEFKEDHPVDASGEVKKRCLREEFWKGYEKRVN